MKRIKRLFSVGLTLIVMLCMSISLIGCKNNNDDDVNKKYDVTIRIACEDGGVWTFPPDVEEMHIEREYDGKEHRYYIQSYQLAEHPQWGNEWLAPKGEGADVFDFEILYTDTQGNQDTELEMIKNKGVYDILVIAKSSSTLWNYRALNFIITVK